jgi:ferrochelatase
MLFNIAAHHLYIIRVVISERFTKKVQEKSTVPIALAMRYGSMSIKKGLKELTDKGVDDILIIPMYPHFAMSSTETVTVKVEEIRKKHHPQVKTTVLPSFYNHPDYIKVMSSNIKEHLNSFEYDHMVSSFNPFLILILP